MKKTPTTWIILDGLGLRGEKTGNAVEAARTPVLDRLNARYAHTSLAASGEDVGLAPFQCGDRAAGRSNLEAGRVVLQPRVRIDRAIADGTFFDHPALCAAVDACLKNGTALHLIGLLSDGGVHSSISHLFALLKMAAIRALPQVFVHAILDGVDVLPGTGCGFLEQTARQCAALGVGKIATVMGRRFAMDRGEHWELLERAYDAMVYGGGSQTDDPLRALAASDVTDDRLEPLVCDAHGTISDHDSVISFNYRADRSRELTRALTDPSFSGFQREFFPITFVSFADGLLPPERCVFSLPEMKNALIPYLVNAGMNIVRTEDTARAVADILSGDCDLVTLCLPDCSVAGHTGDFDRAVAAVEAADAAVGAAVDATLQMGGIAIVAASYGNVEQMRDESGRPFPMNTRNRVPFILCGAGTELRPGGRLADVAPTILDVLGLAQPPEMTGKTLILR